MTRRASRILIARADRHRWESVLLKETGRAEIVHMAADAVDVLVVAEAVDAAGAAADAMDAAGLVAVVDGTKTLGH